MRLDEVSVTNLWITSVVGGGIEFIAFGTIGEPVLTLSGNSKSASSESSGSVLSSEIELRSSADGMVSRVPTSLVALILLSLPAPSLNMSVLLGIAVRFGSDSGLRFIFDLGVLASHLVVLSRMANARIFRNCRVVISPGPYSPHRIIYSWDIGIKS